MREDDLGEAVEDEPVETLEFERISLGFAKDDQIETVRDLVEANVSSQGAFSPVNSGELYLNS